MATVIEREVRRRGEAGGFAELGLGAELLGAVAALGFERPTPIQVAAVPPALEGRDVLACAMTGSGKTAAFLLPILERLRGARRGATRALVLAPTRELAAQIVEHLKELARGTGIRGAAIYGGVGMVPQEEAFRRGVEVLVATPGRLLDHFQHGYARLDGLEVLVLDEADRMLDMGFLPAIRRVLRHLPARRRQTLFFSATMPPPVVALSRELLDAPVRIDIQRRQAPASGVVQALYPVPAHLKVELLHALLDRGEVGNAIVFCRTKHRANRLAEKLSKRGVAVARIHGNRSQSQRTEALAGFKAGRYRVLVATDIVARGIDVEALDHVVNFDVPAASEDYIHRVGRTARAETTGDAYTFVSPETEAQIRSIERALGTPIPRRTLKGFDYAAPPAAERFEIPVEERLRKMRSRRAEERDRARLKAEHGAKPAPTASGSPEAGRAPSPADAQRTAGSRPGTRRRRRRRGRGAPRRG